MDKVVHFEITADDLKRAKNFYKDVFGWEIDEMPEMDYTTVRTGPTDEKGMNKEPGFINGGMMKKDDLIKNPVITIDVASISDVLDKIIDNGGK